MRTTKQYLGSVNNSLNVYCICSKKIQKENGSNRRLRKTTMEMHRTAARTQNQPFIIRNINRNCHVSSFINVLFIAKRFYRTKFPIRTQIRNVHAFAFHHQIVSAQRSLFPRATHNMERCNFRYIKNDKSMHI